jgi:hypothetical protein
MFGQNWAIFAKHLVSPAWDLTAAVDIDLPELIMM